ncbi:MAG: methyltransferase domain-containing protein [Pseudomonadota bacterium]
MTHPDDASAAPQALSFGSDADGYDAGRFDYPEAVYARLATLGLGAGARVFEIGAGSGIATRRVLAAGPARLVAIEPDSRLAALLADRIAGIEGAQIATGPFETAEIPEDAYDLGIAATAWHWCDTGAASARAARLLRPGGHLVLFWNIYRPLSGYDAFDTAAAPLFVEAGEDRAALARSLPDLPAYAQALSVAGFDAIETTTLPWTAPLDAARNRALYASMSMIRALEPAARTRLLDGLQHLAETRFGGTVERQFRTELLTARRASP